MSVRTASFPSLRRLLEPYHHLQFSCPCNSDCFFCYEKDKIATLPITSPEEFKSRLYAVRSAGYTRLFFGSGELVLHPDYQSIIATAKMVGISEVGLISNMTLFTDSIVEKLEKSGLDIVSGSIHSYSDEDALAITGLSHYVTLQRHAIRQIGRSNLEFLPIILLTHSNKNLLWEQILRLQDDYGHALFAVVVSAVHALRTGAETHPYFCDEDGINWPELLTRADAAGIYVLTEHIPACHLGAQHAHRSFQFSRHIARALKGWPSSLQAQKIVRSEFRQNVPISTCELAGACESSNELACRETRAFGLELPLLVYRFINEIQGQYLQTEADYVSQTIKRHLAIAASKSAID